MARINDPILFRLVHDFLQIYLPVQKRASPHTIRAYQISLELLLDYTKEKSDCMLYDVKFEMLDVNMISDFLDYLECERNCAVSTRNHRLKCIMSFLKYAASIEPTVVVHRNEALKVPIKKTAKQVIPSAMSEIAVKTLLNQPDVKTKKGIRNRFMMILLYDTGARINEVLSVRISDFKLDDTPTVSVMGKGSKPRTIPLMNQTVEHMKSYIKVFHTDISPYSNDPLFYISRKGIKTTMSTANAEKLIKQYGKDARKICAEVPENVHPHLFRHSRAMHLYQHGMDLTLIAQWLGHADINTTQIYAYADTEKKREAIAKATECSVELFDEGSTSKFEVDSEDTIKKLYGLR